MELDFEASKKALSDKFRVDVAFAIESLDQTFNHQMQKWAEELKHMHKQRARDRSDIELLISKVTEKLKKTKGRVRELQTISEQHAGMVSDVVLLSV